MQVYYRDKTCIFDQSKKKTCILILNKHVIYVKECLRKYDNVILLPK